MPKGSIFARAMTARDFNEVMKGSQMEEAAKVMARAVLVDGMQIADAMQIAEVTFSRQRAQQVVRLVYDKWAPKGWETSTVTLPAAKMALVRAMVDGERRKLHQALEKR